MIESQDTFDFAKIHQLGFEERFFFLSGFSFTHIHNSQDSSEVCVCVCGGGGYQFNSSLPLSTASQTLRH